MSSADRDRFDNAPRTPGRVGAHRAENPGMRAWVVLLWSLVAVVILVVVGTFLVFLATGRIDPFGGSGRPSAVTPAEEGALDTSYTVLILNGTSDERLDTQVREEILDAGWAEGDVFAGPSGSTDFEATTVYYVNEADEQAAAGLAEVIGGAELVQSDFYADAENSESAQLTVVIGMDRYGSTP